jgi:xylulokinase
MVFWQPREESFLRSGSFDLVRIGTNRVHFESVYSGLIETCLSAVYIHSRHFTRETGEPLYVTDGAAQSQGILQRIASIWNRQVI